MEARNPCSWEVNGRGDNGCCLPAGSMSTLANIQCLATPSPVTLEGVGDFSIVPDMSQPIVVNWPQEQGIECSNADSNKPKISSAFQVSNNTVPVVAKVLQHSERDLIKQDLINHPLCPDAQLTLTFTPPVERIPEIRIPECKVPQVRPPQRPWLQCVENQRISDRVRRPMARHCFRREMPPIVIPCSQFQRIQLKLTEKERKRAKEETRCLEQECERLKSRYRHSLWNYTVESLLDRKKKEEQAKDALTTGNDKTTIEEMKAEKERESLEARKNAEKKMFYSKSLIRNFHSAMATSKTMKEIADEKQVSNCSEEPKNVSPPFLNKICIKKMSWVNKRPDYEKKKVKQSCNKELLELIEKDKKRAFEREAILASEEMTTTALRHEEPLPYMESYLKHIEEPKCDSEGHTNEKELEKARRRDELHEDIQNRLCLDAFITAREEEEERQAKCFNHYFNERNEVIKEKEKQIFQDKVNRNVEASEKAAAKLLEMQAKKPNRKDDYEECRKKWTKEYEAKVLNKKSERGKLMGLIYKDFWERRNEELCKRQLMDASRHWALEKSEAVNNYSMDCVVKETRRQHAEELALYHKAQIADKKCREDKEKHLDCVFGYKAKKADEDEEREMRKYAQQCMQEWAGKGRPLQPMIHAMKQWDYEGGKYPLSPVQMSYVVPHETRQFANCAKTANHPNYETTSNRLGFGSGGT